MSNSHTPTLPSAFAPPYRTWEPRELERSMPWWQKLGSVLVQ